MNLNYAARLATEASVVGLLLIAAGTLAGWIVTKTMPRKVDESCKGWNSDHRMEISLFIAGAALHVALELTGVNAWYVRNVTPTTMSWSMPWAKLLN